LGWQHLPNPCIGSGTHCQTLALGVAALDPCDWSGTRCYVLGLVAQDPCGVWVWKELDSMSFGSGVSRTQQSLGPGHCQTYQLLGLDLTRPNNTWVCLVSHLARLHGDMYVSPTRLKCKKLIPVYFS
jgi:hypothetical protein